MRVATVCALLLAGCAETPAELALPIDAADAPRQPAELLGRWEVVGREAFPLEDDKWLLRADGVAEHVEHDILGDRSDELCRWGVRGDRFEMECPHHQRRGPFRLDGGELSFAPLRRAAAGELEADPRSGEGRLIGLWTSEIEIRSDYAFREEGSWFVGQRSVLRLFDDYTMRGEVVSESGGCTSTIMPFQARCHIDDDLLRCTNEGPFRDRDARGYEVISATLDPATGDPVFEGHAISLSRWVRPIAVD
jgi:hypothetical protein